MKFFDPWPRLIALATLLQHGVGACYVNYDRYYLSTWLLTFLIAIIWLREEGVPWFDRRYPGLRNAWAVG